MKRLIIFIIMSLTLCACDISKQRNAFIESDEIRLQIGRDIPFSYKPLNCQLSFSRENRTFRAQTDNASDYFSVKFTEIPVQLEQELNADLVWTTPIDILHRNNLALKVLRLEGDKVWLWSDSAQIGLSVRILE